MVKPEDLKGVPYSGQLPPDLLAQIGGGSTNRIIKFIWQKE